MDRHLRQILMETPGGRKYLSGLDAAKKAKRARHAPSRKAKAGKRADHRSRSGLLRIAAFNVTGGRCGACSCLLGGEWVMHHILGAGLRRSRQSETNTVALCVVCHDNAHAGNMGTLLMLRAWAEKHGDEETRAELEHRMWRVREARRTA